MTIRDAVNSGRLPNIDYKTIVSICNSFNMPAKDENYDLSYDELKKLQFSPLVHRVSVSNEVKEIHGNLMSKYDSLIKKYEKLSSYMGQSGYLDESKKEIDDLVSKLKEAKNGYQDVIDNVFISDPNFGFDESVLNPIDNIRVQRQNEKIDEVDSELKDEYEKLDDLRSRNYKTKFKKKINEKRINKVCARIEKLQSKQGKMQAIQKRIVNKGSEKYQRRKMKEMEKYYADYKRYQVYSDMKASIRGTREDYTNDINETKKENLELTSEGGLINGTRKVKNNIDIMKMNAKLKTLGVQEKAIEKLRVKAGRCNLSEQYYRTIARSLA